MSETKVRRVHRSKYAKSEEETTIDPWTAALERSTDRPAGRPDRLKAMFAAGYAKATEGEPRKKDRRPSRNFDGRDPETFGFTFAGTVVGSHGVRGSLRVDAETDRANDAALCDEGVKHLLLKGRRAPRPVYLDRGRKLRTLGAKTRFVLSLAGLDTKDAATSLIGADLYVQRAYLQDDDEKDDDEKDDEGDRAEERHAEDDDDWEEDEKREKKRDEAQGGVGIEDVTELANELDGVDCYDRDGNFLGTVFDLLDPTPDTGLAQPLLELDVGLASTADLAGREARKPDGVTTKPRPPRRHCYVPFADPIVHSYDYDARQLTLDPPPGLFDLFFIYEPPPRIIRGFLPPRRQQERKIPQSENPEDTLADESRRGEAPQRT